MSTIVGIDLGTTNSLVAYIKGDRPEIIPNEQGKRLTPSVVALDKTGKLHVGETAKNQLIAMPERTIAEVKRLMGTSRKIRIADREYTPQEVSGFILRKLKDDAERTLGHKIEEAVITVPAYFTDAQRQATKDAGELAGFKVERILNEPTAAALAYGLDHLDKEQYILVYDLGGGTFDVSVLEMFEGVLDVKASAGNNALGGSDFDRRIVDFLVKQFERDHGIDLSRDIRAMARMKGAAEQAKHEISTLDTTSILLPFLATAGAGPLSLECEFSREQFELLVDDLIRSTLEPIEKALHDAKLAPEQIHEVVLVGGSSRIPLVQRILVEKFGKEPKRGVNPDEAIALGAAVQAGIKAGAGSFGSKGGEDARGIMITDVCPYTLGVEVVATSGFQKMSGMFSAIIQRNSTIPVSRTETYSTTADGQSHVDIKVYQGESRLVKNNTFIDQYTIDGIPQGGAGSERINVTFTYDVNGILQVRTKVLSTGKEATLTIERSAERMSEAERKVARDRVEKEWTLRLPPPSAPMAPMSATGSGPGAGAAEGGVKAIVASAERRAKELTGEPRAKLEDLILQLKRAVARGEAMDIVRLDEELTNFLFELG
ncbi:MAG: molecular chaperone DnaK [Myxococcales bacterium]|nr:molecular chaperone DnaK [Myxococcales bacterium]